MDSNVPPESIIKAISEAPSPEAAARANSELLVTPRRSLIASLIIDSEDRVHHPALRVAHARSSEKSCKTLMFPSPRATYGNFDRQQRAAVRLSKHDQRLLARHQDPGIQKHAHLQKGMQIHCVLHNREPLIIHNASRVDYQSSIKDSRCATSAPDIIKTL